MSKEQKDIKLLHLSVVSETIDFCQKKNLPALLGLANTTASQLLKSARSMNATRAELRTALQLPDITLRALVAERV